MKFEDAIFKAIKAYRDGKDPQEYIKARGEPLKYDRKFLDDFEKDVEDVIKSKSGKKKKSKEQ